MNIRFAPIAWLSVALLVAAPLRAATINVTFVPDPVTGYDGFNDPTPFTAEGDNFATTLGQARKNVFNRAAAIWGQRLISGVTIRVQASFAPLTCSSNSGTLGQAGSDYFYPITVGGVRSFYPKALASRINGAEVNLGHYDITAQFNSKVNGDSTCLGGSSFYYGYDQNLGNNDIADLLGVVLHEFGHGLGFLSLVDQDGTEATDNNNNPLPAIFDQFIYDESVGKFWSAMSTSERLTSTTNNQHVVFNDAIPKGARVTGNSSSVLNPVNGGMTTGGRVKLYAPTTWNSGSSISHWDSTANPNLLMEPNYHIETSHAPTDLTTCVMYDMGWGGNRCPDIANRLPVAAAKSATTTMNTAVSVTLSATDADDDTLTYSVATSPAHGTVTSGTGAARTYTPTSGYTGADSFTYKANDRIDDSTAATVSITVNATASSSSSSSSGGTSSSSSSSSSGGSSSSTSSSGGSKSSGGGGSFGGLLLGALGTITLLVARRRMFASR